MSEKGERSTGACWRTGGVKPAEAEHLQVQGDGVGLRQVRTTSATLSIKEVEVEVVETFKYLGFERKPNNEMISTGSVKVFSEDQVHLQKTATDGSLVLFCAVMCWGGNSKKWDSAPWKQWQRGGPWRIFAPSWTMPTFPNTTQSLSRG